MKISAVPSLANSVSAQGVDPQATRIETRRALKMSTNATPLSSISPPDAQELSISDTSSNKDTEPTAEVIQPISPQYAALAKQKRALQVKERELLEREKAILAKSQGSDAIEIARLKSEPLRVLQEAGVTYDQLTEAILANQGNPEVNALKAEITALKEGIDKKFVDRETQAEQQVLAERRREADSLIRQGDDYELVRETGSVPDVMRLIESVYRESGEVLEVNEALKLVEDELFARNQKLAGLKKMQSLFNKPVEPQVAQTQPRQGMRTLTNKDTASVPMDRKARALAAALGTLKR